MVTSIKDFIVTCILGFVTIFMNIIYIIAFVILGFFLILIWTFGKIGNCKVGKFKDLFNIKKL